MAFIGRVWFMLNDQFSTFTHMTFHPNDAIIKVTIYKDRHSKDVIIVAQKCMECVMSLNISITYLAQKAMINHKCHNL